MSFPLVRDSAVMSAAAVDVRGASSPVAGWSAASPLALDPLQDELLLSLDPMHPTAPAVSPPTLASGAKPASSASSSTGTVLPPTSSNAGTTPQSAASFSPDLMGPGSSNPGPMGMMPPPVTPPLSPPPSPPGTNGPAWYNNPSIYLSQSLPAAPAFSQTPYQSSAEASSPSIQVQATDPGGYSLTYGATNLPPGLVMTPSGAVSGTITYSAAQEAGGWYWVTVVAVDSQGASATENFAWTVTNTDQAPTLNNPGNQTNAEQDGAWVPLTASDPDGNTLTYSATGLPSGATIDPTTGLISGMIDTTAAANSPYTTTVTVSDGTLSDSQSFTWTVTNGPPSVTYPGYQTNAQGDAVSLQISATDPHGASLTYSATGLPPGLAIDSGSGVISGTISPTASTGGPYDTTVSVSNGALSASTEFSWTVTPLSVINPGPQTNATGDTVSLGRSEAVIAGFFVHPETGSGV